MASDAKSRRGIAGSGGIRPPYHLGVMLLLADALAAVVTALVLFRTALA